MRKRDPQREKEKERDPVVETGFLIITLFKIFFSFAFHLNVTLTEFKKRQEPDIHQYHSLRGCGC